MWGYGLNVRLGLGVEWVIEVISGVMGRVRG